MYLFLCSLLKNTSHKANQVLQIYPLTLTQILHKMYLLLFLNEKEIYTLQLVPSEPLHVTFSGGDRYFPSYPQGGRLIPFLLERTLGVIIKDHSKLTFLCDYFLQINEVSLFTEDAIF